MLLLYPQGGKSQMIHIVSVISLIFIILHFSLFVIIFIPEYIKKKKEEKNKESEVSRYKKIIRLWLYDDNNGQLSESEIEQLAKHLLFCNPLADKKYTHKET